MPSLRSRYLIMVLLLGFILLLTNNVSFADLDSCNPPKLTPERAERLFPSSDDFIQKYVRIWKRMFQEKNNLNDKDFDKHIHVIWAYGLGRAPSTAFNIHYYAKVAWFQALVTEQLIVYLPSTDDAYKYLNLKRDMYLSEEEIRILVERAHSPDIRLIDMKQPLAISNMEAAFAEINKVTKHKIFSPDLQEPKCSFYKGDPILRVFGVLNEKENICLNGFVNIRTGEASVDNSPCRIN